MKQNINLQIRLNSVFFQPICTQPTDFSLTIIVELVTIFSYMMYENVSTIGDVELNLC